MAAGEVGEANGAIIRVSGAWFGRVWILQDRRI